MHEYGVNIDGIASILNYLETNTVPLLITAIVIFFSIRFGNLGFVYIANRLKEKRHEELIDIRSNVNKTINNLIDRAMLRCNACRAYVFEFHNGITALGGLPLPITSRIPSATKWQCRRSTLKPTAPFAAEIGNISFGCSRKLRKIPC